MSQQQLAEIAKIDKQTICRIEKGHQRTTRQHVLKQLAAALNIEPEVLIGEGPMPELQNETELPIVKSQLNIRIGTTHRNFLNLVAIRYKVKPSQIVELAPFLFCWAAEDSLRKRKARLAEFEQVLCQCERLGEQFRHLLPSINLFPYSDDAVWAEDHSIAQRDLFGAQVELNDIGVAPKFVERENPFAEYLRGLASDLGDVATFEDWDNAGVSPYYRACPEEAAEFVGGDADRAEEILLGQVALNEMPSEFRKSGMANERAAWVRAKAAEFRQKRDRDLAELLALVDWESESPLSDLTRSLSEKLGGAPE